MLSCCARRRKRGLGDWKGCPPFRRQSRGPPYSQPGGTFVAKFFRGSNVTLLYNQLRLLFDRVSIAKPTSSRNSSIEAFVVCEKCKEGPQYQNLPLDLEGYFDLEDTLGGEATEQLDPFVVPFLACVDLSGWSKTGQHLDADASYPIDIREYLPPVARPIYPAYETSISQQKNNKKQAPSKPDS